MYTRLVFASTIFVISATVSAQTQAESPTFAQGDEFRFCSSGYYNRDVRSCYTLVFHEARDGIFVFISTADGEQPVETIYTT